MPFPNFVAPRMTSFFLAKLRHIPIHRWIKNIRKKGLQKSTRSIAENGVGVSEDIDNAKTLLVLEISSALTTLKTRNKNMHHVKLLFGTELEQINITTLQPHAIFDDHKFKQINI